MQEIIAYVVYDGGLRVHFNNPISANLLNTLCNYTKEHSAEKFKIISFSSVTEYCILKIKIFEEQLKAILLLHENIDWVHYPIDNEFYNPDYRERIIRESIEKYISFLEKSLPAEKIVLYPSTIEEAKTILNRYRKEDNKNEHYT